MMCDPITYRVHLSLEVAIQLIVNKLFLLDVVLCNTNQGFKIAPGENINHSNNLNKKMISKFKQFQKALKSICKMILTLLKTTWDNWRDPETDQTLEHEVIDHLLILNYRSKELRVTDIEKSDRRAKIQELSKERSISCELLDHSTLAIGRFLNFEMKSVEVKRSSRSVAIDLESFTKYWIFAQLAFSRFSNK